MGRFICRRAELLECEHTNRDDEKADIVQPIRRLAGQMLYEAAQDGAEVALVSAHRHLHRGRSQGVTVTAGHRSHTVRHR